MRSKKSTSTKIARFALAPAALALIAFLLIGYPRSFKDDAKVPNLTQNMATIPSPVPTIYLTYVPSTVTPATPRPTEPPMTVQHLRQMDFGSWSYSAGRRSDGQVVAGVSYDNATVNDLNLYATANRVLATQLASQGGQVRVNITFRTYMQPEAFRTWVSARGLQVDKTELRYVDGSGLDTTVWYKPLNEGPLPQSFVDQQLEWARQNNVGVREFKGVYFTSGSIDTVHLLEIAADPLVFLADVTHQAVRNDLVDAGITGAAQAIVSITPPSPFWKMEHVFGLQNFQR